MDHSIESQFAIDAVREAALLVRSIQREMIGEALSKQDRSPVTVADFAAQALVARRLAENFPGADLIGEEQADALRLEEGISALDQVTAFVRRAIPDTTPEEVCGLIDRGTGDPAATFWTLDPIDGTKGFLRGEQYAVALAFIHDGEVEIGVLGCPGLSLGDDENGENGTTLTPRLDGKGALVVALRGKGTHAQPLDIGQSSSDLSWQALSVSARDNSADARILRSVEKAHTNTDEIAQLATRLGVTTPTVGMDSQAKYAMLAAGGGDVLLRLLSPARPDYREKIWDQAAGALVVTEAGGRITDLDGQPLDFSQGRTLAKNRGILATNRHLHHPFLDAIRRSQ